MSSVAALTGDKTSSDRLLHEMCLDMRPSRFTFCVCPRSARQVSTFKETGKLTPDEVGLC